MASKSELYYSTNVHIAVEVGDSDYLHDLLSGRLKDSKTKILGELNVQNKKLQTALILAVATNKIAAVQPLLSAGCDPDLQDKDGNTALHLAIKNK